MPNNNEDILIKQLLTSIKQYFSSRKNLKAEAKVDELLKEFEPQNATTLPASKQSSTTSNAIETTTKNTVSDLFKSFDQHMNSIKTRIGKIQNANSHLKQVLDQQEVEKVKVELQQQAQ